MRRTVLLLIALFAVFWSAPLIRLSAEAPASVIAFWRTAIGTVALLPFALTRHRGELRSLDLRSWLETIGTGAILAVHFAAWVSAVNLTTVASSALIVTSSPIFVALGSYLLGERLSGRVWLGIGMALGGGSLVALDGLSDASGGRGEMLAAIGSIGAAGYFLMGRRLRSRLSVVSYGTVVYGVCALILGAWALITGAEMLDHPAPTWWAIIGVGLGPQLVGHTLLNYLLEHLEASKIAVAVMAEPVGSAAIAAVLFGEVPGPIVLPGAALLLFGIWLTLRARGPEVILD